MEDFSTMFTACRTKLINDTIAQWIYENSGKEVQITNMGAGVDTRAYWLDCLKNAARYVEVDQ
jgi:O-methyltransferase involved in polyketide biosynthesis